jgi:transcriptional regulator with XRE-family HTH domain
MSLEKLVIDNIKRIRKEKGMSQEKLAEACNTATSYIGLMEIYRNVPKLSTIERIARALDVDPLIFFQRPDTGEAPDDSNELEVQKEIKVRRIRDSLVKIIEEHLTVILRRYI